MCMTNAMISIASIGRLGVYDSNDTERVSRNGESFMNESIDKVVIEIRIPHYRIRTFYCTQTTVLKKF